MQFRGYYSRNSSSGMHPYDHRQSNYRDGPGGDRARNQEGRTGSNYMMSNDKNKSEDFVVLSLEEIRRRKSENLQAEAENKGRYTSSSKDQMRDAQLMSDDSKLNNESGLRSREVQNSLTKVKSPGNDKNMSDQSPKRSPQAAPEAVDAPDYEMSDDEFAAERSPSPGGNSTHLASNGGDDGDNCQDHTPKDDVEASGSFKKYKRQSGHDKTLVQNREERENSHAKTREGYHSSEMMSDNHWTPSRQSPRQNGSHDTHNTTSSQRTQVISPQDSRDPWKIQDQPATWCVSTTPRNTSTEQQSQQNDRNDQPSLHRDKEYGDMYIDNQRTSKYGNRDGRRSYNDSGYYDNIGRSSIRDEDIKRRESPQNTNTNEYRSDYNDRQNFNQTHGGPHRYSQYDRRMNNSNYADREHDRHQHGKGWNNWQYGEGKLDPARQGFGPSDTYRDQSKPSGIPPHQQDVLESSIQKSDYDDDTRTKGVSRMGYERKDARFTHQGGLPSNRFSQRGAVQATSSHALVTNDDMVSKLGTNTRYGDRGYDSNFQRSSHRKGGYFWGSKDDYSHYPQQDMREELRHDPRRLHRAPHSIDPQNDIESDQGLKRGKQIDSSGFQSRGRPPKRSRTYVSPQSPSRGGDEHEEIIPRDRGSVLNVSLTESSTQEDHFYPRPVNCADFYSIERAVMTESLSSVCSSFFESIDRGAEPSFECCKKILVASSSREEVIYMRKILSYMQHVFRERLRAEDYIIAAQCYALIGDSQNIRAIRDHAAKLGLVFSPISWVQLLRCVISVKKSTPDIIRIVVEEVIKGQVTQKLVAASDFLLQQCLEFSLTDECIQIIHKFRKIPPEFEPPFDSRTLTDLTEHLMSLSDFKIAYQIIQFSYSCKRNVEVKTALNFVSECASRQRHSHLAKQAYLMFIRHDRFSYKDVNQLKDIVENLSKSKLISESIVVLQDIVSSSLPIGSTRALVTLLTTITSENDCKEAIVTFKQLLSQRFLIPRQNIRLYEEITRFFFRYGTSENIMWLRDHLSDMCIAVTPAMKRLIFSSEGTLLSNSDIAGLRTPDNGSQDMYQNTPFGTTRPID